MTCPALQFLIVTVAGWLNRKQVAGVEYLIEENRVLRAQLDGRRLRLTDAQRRRLAVKGKALGRKALADVASIVIPDTILRWHRELAAKKYDGSRRRGPGRPRTAAFIDEERNHQGPANAWITPPAKVTTLAAPIQRRERVGGVLNDYYREAA